MDTGAFLVIHHLTTLANLGSYLAMDGGYVTGMDCF